ncbi:Putative ribonuclease H protein At1g65750, partial [Linum perenne]
FITDLCSLDARYSWRIPLSNTLRGGALREWNHLINRLEALPPDFIKSGPAALYWPLEKSGIFSVRSMRRRLAEDKVGAATDFPHEVIWESKAPTKIQTFLWMAYHKKLATIDNLQKRGIHLVSRCVLCEVSCESVDHLLWQCSFTKEVWQRVSSLLSIFGPHCRDLDSILTGWKGLNFSPFFPETSSVLLHAFLWFSWLERNDRVFNDKAKSVDQVVARILSNIGRWLAAWNVFSPERLCRWNSFIFDPG